VLWVGQDPCIAEQVAAKIPDSAVANLAADGFTTADTLEGSKCVISVGMRGRQGVSAGCDPLEYEEDGRFCPLTRLAKLEPPPTHVVLSVGGNDVREILRDMGKLPQVVQEYGPKYIDILDVCATVTPNIILMFQYRPSYFMEGGGYGVYQAIASIPGPGDPVQKMNMLMQTIYAPILNVAKDRRLAILDLPRTFDIFKDELYSHQIEPSAQGGAVISALVEHAVKHHTLEKPSTLYSYSPCVPDAGDVTEHINNEAPWTIPHDSTKVPNLGASAETQKVIALVGMGFERSQVEAALARNNGDQGKAVAELLGDASH